MFKYIKELLIKTKAYLQDNSFDSLLWMVDIMPSKVGFSILQDNIRAPFWILHFVFLMYVYVIGIADYQVKYAHGAGDFIKSYVNILLVILVANNSYWFIKERPLLRTVLVVVKKNDYLSRQFVPLQVKHKNLMWVIKKILLIFYGFNLLDAVFIYIPHRADVTTNNFSMTPCVGLEPISLTPNRQICTAIIVTQELAIVIVVLNYQALLLFLIAHTTAMYQMLTEEIMMFDEKENLPTIDALVKDRLHVLIRRHVSILHTIDKLKSLYSFPLGLNFGVSTVCISFFFYLPLQEWLQYIPIVVYCFFVFFLYCFLCQRLINASEVFERAIYSCGWENFSVYDQKTMYFFLLQAQKPIVLLAADIIPVNIYTFATTLQFMFKFVTVVKL